MKHIKKFNENDRLNIGDLFRKNSDQFEYNQHKFKALCACWNFDPEFIKKCFTHLGFSFDETDVLLDLVDAQTDTRLSLDERGAQAWEQYCENNGMEHEIENHPFHTEE